MSTEIQPVAPEESPGPGAAGPEFAAPELTPLGKRIEMLRIERGISKQHLARFAGTSRQQLWRVMTGKSELTGSLRDRLAEALLVEAPSLSAMATTTGAAAAATWSAAGSIFVPAPEPAPANELAEYLANADAVAATLRTMPGGPAGRRLKRAFLDTLEDAAVEQGLTLDARVFELRRAVVAGEL
jgi:transcriptional regulator with XRE-family HTH domain